VPVEPVTWVTLGTWNVERDRPGLNDRGDEWRRNKRLRGDERGFIYRWRWYEAPGPLVLTEEDGLETGDDLPLDSRAALSFDREGHGTARKYRQGCRCEWCTRNQKHRMRNYRAKKRKGL
jgi:hypothetical protein